MASAKPNQLRTIAEHEFDACFHDLVPTTRGELATSLVRQWITHQGAAVVLTRDHQYWFNLTKREDGTSQVVREVQDGTFAAQLRRSRVLEEQIPEVLHELNLCQSAHCTTDCGETLQLRVEPCQRMLHVDLALDRPC